mmetsp:Transcript_48153/g.110637  ORF Transcript_48153/g.110637 Transcript_48153/m.110637 type:complete len:233 (-) Transcript_48153:87-785(-)
MGARAGRSARRAAERAIGANFVSPAAPAVPRVRASQRVPETKPDSQYAVGRGVQGAPAASAEAAACGALPARRLRLHRHHPRRGALVRARALRRARNCVRASACARPRNCSRRACAPGRGAGRARRHGRQGAWRARFLQSKLRARPGRRGGTLRHGIRRGGAGKFHGGKFHGCCLDPRVPGRPPAIGRSQAQFRDPEIHLRILLQRHLSHAIDHLLSLGHILYVLGSCDCMR